MLGMPLKCWGGGLLVSLACLGTIILFLTIALGIPASAWWCLSRSVSRVTRHFAPRVYESFKFGKARDFSRFIGYSLLIALTTFALGVVLYYSAKNYCEHKTFKKAYDAAWNGPKKKEATP